MKNKKVLVAVLAAVLITAAVFGGLWFAGFFKLTPMKLVRRSMKELAKVQSFDSDVRMEYEGSIAFMGKDVDFALNSDCNLKGVIGTGTTYMNGTMGTKLPILGELSVPVEGYQQYRDTGMVSYTRLGNSGWLLNEVQQVQVPEEGVRFNLDYKVVLGIMQKISDGELKAELAEETEQLRGQEVYRMNISVTGDLLGEIVQALASSQGNNAAVPKDFDISDGDAEIELYIYKETRLPAKLVIDCTALGRAVIRNLLKNSAAGESVSTGTNRFVITADVLAYNTVDEITVPQEVILSAVKPQQFDLLSIFMGK